MPSVDFPVGFHREEPPQRDSVRRFAVLGYPVEHSRSPQLHLSAYRALGLDWEYSRWEIAKDALTATLQNRGAGWGGFSVTAPHKAEALSFVRSASEDAVRSGAVNTIVFDSVAAESTAVGENTDIPGAIDAFSVKGITNLTGRVDVLGGGGTASSLAIAALRLGADDVRIWARRPEAAAQLAAELGSGVTSGDLAEWSLREGVSAVVDTVPNGYLYRADQLDPSLIPHAALFSAAYSPWPTQLAQAWLDADGTIVTGLDLLLYQAVRQIRLFSGLDIDTPLPNETSIIETMRASLKN